MNTNHNKAKSQVHRHGNKTTHTQRRKLVLSIVCVALLLVAAMFAGDYLQNSVFNVQEVRGDLSSLNSDLRKVEYNGETYAYNDTLTTILFMGIDKTTEQLKASSGFRNGGQADFLGLMVIDAQKKTVGWLPIDRDSMTQITVLGVLGNPAGTRTSQICLSHGFGDGGETSSELTVQAVETMLYGMQVDFYISLDLRGIETVNDLVGGIAVTLEDDFSALDPTMLKGATITLQGKQAEYYVRSRMTIGDGSNQARMKRQASYLGLLKERVAEMLNEDSAFINRLYDTMDPYMVTNMKRGRLVNEANKAQKYQQLPDFIIKGEHTMGADGFVEFHIDQASLEALVVDTFLLELDDNGNPS